MTTPTQGVASTPLDILYRGPLASCNYDCWYCPFAKTTHTKEALAADAAGLARFVQWVGTRTDLDLSVLFTPWGEALPLGHYQEALVALSQMPHVTRVAIQTNATGSLSWLESACLDTLRLWVTFHPSEIAEAEFVRRCHHLSDRGVRYSVGIVGLREHLDTAERLRRTLPEDRYLWVNAFRDPAAPEAPAADYYQTGEALRFSRVDPWFDVNLVGHPEHGHRSEGRSCRAGHSSISVDGDGNVRRCHFVGDVIGSLYGAGPVPRFLVGRELEAERQVAASPCPNAVCDCHIGYVHLTESPSKLSAAFGRDALTRQPLTWAAGQDA